MEEIPIDMFRGMELMEDRRISRRMDPINIHLAFYNKSDPLQCDNYRRGLSHSSKILVSMEKLEQVNLFVYTEGVDYRVTKDVNCAGEVTSRLAMGTTTMVE